MTRRGRNEGSIYQREDGRWVGSASLGVIAGKRRRKVVYGSTKREVQSKLREVQDAAARGLPVVGDRLTVERFLAEWLEAARPGLRPRTAMSYASHVRLYIVPAIGGVPLAKLSPGEVQRMLGALQERGLSPQTVAHVRASLRRALGQAERWGYVSRNVARLVDPPKVERAPVDPLRADEVQAFLASVRDDRRYALYLTAIATGLRQGELLGLRWADVDLDAGMAHVTVALGRKDGRPALLPPKTTRSRRRVPLAPMVVEALREHRRRQLEDRLLAGSRWAGEAWGLVFPTTIGTPMSPADVTHAFQAALARSGVRRQRFHDLRHAAASLWLARGISPRVVMELLGHSTITTTMNVYSHVIPSLERDAADQMQEVLAGSA